MSMEKILQTRVVPAATVESEDAGVRLAGALLEAGLDIIEITFRTEAAGAAIRAIAETYPKMLIGAGTVLTAEQLDRAIDAGIGFAVAPGLNEAIVERAMAAGIAFMPGVATPTEVDRALQVGAEMLKFFPAANLGGVKTLKALGAPYAHTGVKFIPTGGINASNAAEYLELPVVAAVGGSWMVKKELVAAGDWAEITRLSHEAVAICSHA